MSDGTKEPASISPGSSASSAVSASSPSAPADAVPRFAFTIPKPASSAPASAPVASSVSILGGFGAVPVAPSAASASVSSPGPFGAAAAATRPFPSFGGFSAVAAAASAPAPVAPALSAFGSAAKTPMSSSIAFGGFGSAPSAPTPGASSPSFGGFGSAPSAPTPVASTPSFGGFGSTPTPVASAPSYGGFGATPSAVPASSTPAFGGFGSAPSVAAAPTPVATTPAFGGFGSAPPPAQSGFGISAAPASVAATPTFGGFGSTPVAPSSSFGGFGSAPPASGFGASPASGFGAAPASGFGASAPASGFGAPLVVTAGGFSSVSSNPPPAKVSVSSTPAFGFGPRDAPPSTPSSGGFSFGGGSPASSAATGLFFGSSSPSCAPIPSSFFWGSASPAVPAAGGVAFGSSSPAQQSLFGAVQAAPTSAAIPIGSAATPATPATPAFAFGVATPAKLDEKGVPILPEPPKSAFEFYKEKERLKVITGQKSGRKGSVPDYAVEWKKLKDSGKEKYHEMAAADLRRYEAEVAAYKAAGGDDSKLVKANLFAPSSVVPNFPPSGASAASGVAVAKPMRTHSLPMKAPSLSKEICDLFGDVTLVVGPEAEEIKAPKWLLTASSTLFKEMIEDNNDSDTLVIPDVQAFAMRLLIELITTGTCSIEPEERGLIVDVVLTAQHLQMYECVKVATSAAVSDIDTAVAAFRRLQDFDIDGHNPLHSALSWFFLNNKHAFPQSSSNSKNSGFAFGSVSAAPAPAPNNGQQFGGFGFAAPAAPPAPPAPSPAAAAPPSPPDSNLKTLLLSEALRDASLDTLLSVLGQPNLTIPQGELFAFLVSWIDRSVARGDANGDRRALFSYVRHLLNLRTLTFEDLKNFVLPSKLIDEHELVGLFKTARSAVSTAKAQPSKFPARLTISAHSHPISRCMNSQQAYSRDTTVNCDMCSDTGIQANAEGFYHCSSCGNWDLCIACFKKAHPFSVAATAVPKTSSQSTTNFFQSIQPGQVVGRSWFPLGSQARAHGQHQAQMSYFEVNLASASGDAAPAPAPIALIGLCAANVKRTPISQKAAASAAALPYALNVSTGALRLPDGTELQPVFAAPPFIPPPAAPAAPAFSFDQKPQQAPAVSNVFGQTPAVAAKVNPFGQPQQPQQPQQALSFSFGGFSNSSTPAPAAIAAPAPAVVAESKPMEAEKEKENEKKEEVPFAPEWPASPKVVGFGVIRHNRIIFATADGALFMYAEKPRMALHSLSAFPAVQLAAPLAGSPSVPAASIAASASAPVNSDPTPSGPGDSASLLVSGKFVPPFAFTPRLYSGAGGPAGKLPPATGFVVPSPGSKPAPGSWFSKVAGPNLKFTQGKRAVECSSGLSICTVQSLISEGIRMLEITIAPGMSHGVGIIPPGHSSMTSWEDCKFVELGQFGSKIRVTVNHSAKTLTVTRIDGTSPREETLNFSRIPGPVSLAFGLYACCKCTIIKDQYL